MVNVGVVISYSVDSDKDFDDEVDVNYTNLYGWQSFQPINENNYKFLTTSYEVAVVLAFAWLRTFP